MRPARCDEPADWSQPRDVGVIVRGLVHAATAAVATVVGGGRCSCLHVLGEVSAGTTACKRRENSRCSVARLRVPPVRALLVRDGNVPAVPEKLSLSSQQGWQRAARACLSGPQPAYTRQ